jgi:hypothetical protein
MRKIIAVVSKSLQEGARVEVEVTDHEKLVSMITKANHIWEKELFLGIHNFLTVPITKILEIMMTMNDGNQHHEKKKLKDLREIYRRLPVLKINLGRI